MIQGHKHGGDIYSNQVKVDFSANINPYGMPPQVCAAAKAGVEESIHYPDVECRELCAAIAEQQEVETEWIRCGNGAAEVIFQLVQAYRPSRALLVLPTFAEYGQALATVNCEIETVMLSREEEFLVTDRILASIHSGLDLMFLCNPNNPTGQVVSPELCERILKRCEECNVLLVMDECFQDFLPEELAYSMKHRLKESNHLFILKAFTKMYGMAGLRLGYGLCSNRELLEKMKYISQPWNVSIPAQRAGIAACQEAEFARRSRDKIAVERERLSEALVQLGLRVYGSRANYIFFEGPAGLYERCLKHGIMIRSCSNYEGLGEQFYRVAVKLPEENEQLIKCLEQIKGNYTEE